MLLLPSSLPCVSVAWGCLVYCCSVTSCAVLVSGMLCPVSSEVMQPPPPPAVCTGTWLVGWLAVGFRVSWLVVGFVGWLLVDGFLDS